MDFNPNQPIYQQIADAIKQMIVKGELTGGEKIKPVRELAQDMQVNPNTMQKALSSLEAEGLLYTERTAGRFVTKDKERINRLREQMVAQIADQFLQTMEQMGFDQASALHLLQSYTASGKMSLLF